jgi:hypothetical protein
MENDGKGYLWHFRLTLLWFSEIRSPSILLPSILLLSIMEIQQTSSGPNASTVTVMVNPKIYRINSPHATCIMNQLKYLTVRYLDFEPTRSWCDLLSATSKLLLYLLHNPVDMVHQHLRLTHTHTHTQVVLAVVSIMLPISILSNHRESLWRTSKPQLKQRYGMSATHACCQSHKQRHQWWWFPSTPSLGCPAQWQWGMDMECLYLARLFLHSPVWWSHGHGISWLHIGRAILHKISSRAAAASFFFSPTPNFHQTRPLP